MKKFKVTVKFKSGNTLTRVISEKEHNNLLKSDGVKEGYIKILKSCEEGEKDND